MEIKKKRLVIYVVAAFLAGAAVRALLYSTGLWDM